MERSRSYSFVRTTPGSTLRASANMQGRKWELLKIEVYDETDEKCDSSQLLRIGTDTRLVLGVQAVAEAECDEPGTHLITVTRDPYGSKKPEPFQLRIVEEPPVIDPGVASPGRVVEIVKPKVPGEVKPAVGGASFDNAALIGAGRWSGTVVPGETVMYKRPLEFGQSARVRTYFPKANRARRKYSGALGNATSVALYNPMRAQLKTAKDGARTTNYAGGERAQSLLTGTPAVGRNLIDVKGSGTSGGEDYSMAGEYFLGVSMANDRGETIEYPFAIDVEILGDPVQGPTYADDVTWSVAEGASGPYGPQSQQASPSPSGPAQPTSENPAGEAVDKQGVEESSQAPLSG